MSLDQTANFVRATLSSAIAAGDTTIALADSGQLVDPANGKYNLVVWDPASYPRPGQDPAVEIVRATALDSGANTLTVDRGQEGTSAADHPVEAVLQLSPTAKLFSDIDAKTSALSADGQTFAGDAIDVGSVATGSVNTDDLSIKNSSAALESTTDQSIQASTDTTVNWDNQDIDTGLYSFDSNANELTVLEDGDYTVNFAIEFDNVSDQEFTQFKITRNGNTDRAPREKSSSPRDGMSGSGTLKNLTAGDVLRFDVRLGSSGTLIGNDTTTYTTVTRDS